jgi:hypothetical protein
MGFMQSHFAWNMPSDTQEANTAKLLIYKDIFLVKDVLPHLTPKNWG